jgi:predicted transcriptional regulator
MAGRLVPAVLLALFMLSFAAPASAFITGYSVEPAYGSVGKSAADLKVISFWELSLREMAIVFALALSPACLFPVEIFFALKFFSCLGFRRIARNNILKNGTRQAIYQCITINPGINFHELCKSMEISRGALDYHLRLLKFQGKITVFRTHGGTSFFVNTPFYDDLDRKVLASLRNDTEKTILKTLVDRDDLSRQDLEKLLAVSGPSVTWYMKRLADEGILCVRKEGRYARYMLTEKTQHCIRKFLDQSPAVHLSPVGPVSRESEIGIADPCS